MTFDELRSEYDVEIFTSKNVDDSMRYMFKLYDEHGESHIYVVDMDYSSIDSLPIVMVQDRVIDQLICDLNRTGRELPKRQPVVAEEDSKTFRRLMIDHGVSIEQFYIRKSEAWMVIFRKGNAKLIRYVSQWTIENTHTWEEIEMELVEEFLHLIKEDGVKNDDSNR